MIKKFLNLLNRHVITTKIIRLSDIKVSPTNLNNDFSKIIPINSLTRDRDVGYDWDGLEKHMSEENSSKIRITKDLYLLDGHHRCTLLSETKDLNDKIEVKMVKYNYIWVLSLYILFLPILILTEGISKSDRLGNFIVTLILYPFFLTIPIRFFIYKNKYDKTKTTIC